MSDLRFVIALSLVCACSSSPDGDAGGDTGGSTSEPGTSSGDPTGSDGTAEPSEDGSTSGDGSSSDDGGTTEAETSDGTDSTGGSVEAFDIAFDYRFDRQMAVAEDQQAVLDAAAGEWEAHILSEFDDIPAGTALRSRHPEAPGDPGMVFEIEYAIDDLVVFPGYAAIDGPTGSLALTFHSFTNQVADPVLLEALDARFYGPAFQPWVAATTFDPAENWFVDPTPDTADDIPAGQMDMKSTAIHELGHALGVGGSAAFEAWVDADAETFIGPRAMEVYGGPVPLAGDLVHIRGDVLSDGQEPAMAFGTMPGQRKSPTPLDLAVLEDIGYATDL